MTFAAIKRAVADYYSVPVRILEGPCKRKEYVRARHVAMYLGQRAAHLSSPQIGSRLGGRDHSTVLHGIRCIEKLMLSDHETCFAVAWIEAHASRYEEDIHKASTTLLWRSLSVPAVCGMQTA